MGAKKKLLENSRTVASGENNTKENQASPSAQTKNSNQNNKSSIVSSGQTLLERFMLMREIGQGGTSRVFRARDLLAVLGGNLSESDIAIKVVTLPEQFSHGDKTELLLNEALITRHLSHPNIAKVYDYHKDGDTVFVTMELVEGESLASLRNRLPAKKIPYNRVVAILDQVILAIGYAHKSSVIHSDIKPSNILITQNGVVKIIDFATSRSLNGSKKDKSNPADTNSFHAYTAAYASPRLINDDAPSIGDDLYSLARVTYEVLSGESFSAPLPSNHSSKNNKTPGATITGDLSAEVDNSGTTKPVKKPKAINYFQWYLLKLAMSDSGSLRFGSVSKFWQRFKWARYGYHFLLLITLIPIMTLQAFDYFYTMQDQQQSIVTKSPVETYEQRFENIAELPLQQQLKILSELPVNDASHFTIDTPIKDRLVLGLLRPTLIESLSEHTRTELAVDTSSYQVPPFSELLTLNQHVLTHFPDSIQIHNNINTINHELDQYINFLAYEYDRLWHTNVFDIETANNINRVSSSLNSLGTSRSKQSDVKYVESVATKMTDAIKRGDYLAFYELHSFLELLEDVPASTVVLNHFKTDFMTAAKALIHHREDKSAYPNDAASLWADNRVTELQQQLQTVATLDELNRLHQEFDQLLSEYRARYHTEFVHPVTQQLVSTYEKFIESRDQNRATERDDPLIEQYELLQSSISIN